MPRVLQAATIATLLICSACASIPEQKMDIGSLWDFSNPAASEERFKEAAVGATKDQILVLNTQIARTHGMRRDFQQARAILAELESQLVGASPESQTRYHLELGRTYASTAHSKEQQTPAAIEAARQHYVKAFEIAAKAELDYLAIDALHMMPVVDTAPDEQLIWNQKALNYLENSSQADAKSWEGSLRNNVGYALHLKGEYEQAISQFELSRHAFERDNKDGSVRIANWMIAWTLRAQEKYAEALQIQLNLERQWDEIGKPDPYVYEELETLYRLLGDEEKAITYRNKYETVTT